jgi:hypothetical protein
VAGCAGLGGQGDEPLVGVVGAGEEGPVEGEPADDRTFEYYRTPRGHHPRAVRNWSSSTAPPHIDLYDKDEYVTPAVAKLTEFFGKHLAG